MDDSSEGGEDVDGPPPLLVDDDDELPPLLNSSPRVVLGGDLVDRGNNGTFVILFMALHRLTMESRRDDNDDTNDIGDDMPPPRRDPWLGDESVEHDDLPSPPQLWPPHPELLLPPPDVDDDDDEDEDDDGGGDDDDDDISEPPPLLPGLGDDSDFDDSDDDSDSDFDNDDDDDDDDDDSNHNDIDGLPLLVPRGVFDDSDFDDSDDDSDNDDLPPLMMRQALNQRHENGNFPFRANFRNVMDRLERAAAHQPPRFVETIAVEEVNALSRVIKYIMRDDVNFQVDVERNDVPAFRRFVALLGQQEGGVTVRNITFSLDFRGLPDPDMERLFRDVLPAHNTLESIEINVFFLPTRFLRMLAESLPTQRATPLSRLVLHGGANGPERCAEQAQVVAHLLERNSAITNLDIAFDLTGDRCRLICQALSRNTHLRELRRRLDDMLVDSLDGVAESSSLRSLYVWGPFSDDDLSSLVTQLRTNTTLWHLTLQDTNPVIAIHLSPVLHDFARTYNYTLRTLEAGLPGVAAALDVYMTRNARIRHVLEHLPDPTSSTAPPKHLLPTLLGVVSDVPTVLQRVLRVGYGGVISDHLLRAQVDDCGDGHGPDRH